MLGSSADRGSISQEPMRLQPMLCGQGATCFPVPVRRSREHEMTPPLRTFAACLIELQHAVRLRPPEVECDASAGDDRPHPVVHVSACFIVVESEVQPASKEVA